MARSGLEQDCVSPCRLAITCPQLWARRRPASFIANRLPWVEIKWCFARYALRPAGWVMRFEMPRALWIVLGLCVGCGQAAGPHFNPPFATLFGVISSSSVPTPSEVRVALVWRKHDPEGNILRVAQELGVRADFPVRFRLDIDTLPPADAINLGTNADGTPFHYATGSLIIYED